MKYLYFLLILFVSCVSNKEIKIVSKPNNSSEIIAWYNKKSNKIWAISFPFNLNIKSKGENFLYNFQYKYKNSSNGAVIKMYYIDNKEYIRVENYEKREFSNQPNKTFLFYTKHLIIDGNDSKKILSEIDTNSIKNDSILIGSFSSFNKKFPKTANNIMQGDTLYLRFKEILGEKKRRVKVPIKL